VPDANAPFQPLFDRLNQHSKLALAVSGGPDSTALMWLAAQWAKTHGKLDSLYVLTIDHGLREAAPQDARQVCKWAKALGLQCNILSWQHDGPTSGIQEKARAGRYQLMANWCRDNGFDGVVTAHHRDDQAETMLMRLARGSGVDGLSAMAGRSEIFGLAVYRPLLEVSPDDLQQVLKNAGHDWLEDPANQNEQFERVRVRGSMTAIENAGVDSQALGLSAKRLRRARSALETMTDRFMADGVTVFETGHCEVDRATFEAQPDEICLRTLNRLIMWAGGGKIAVRMAKVERLLETLDTSNKHTLAGAQIAMRKNMFVIGREFGRIVPDLQRQVHVWDNRFIFNDTQNVQPYGLFIDQAPHQRPQSLPHFVACSLPAFFDQTGKFTIPHLEPTTAGMIHLSSLPEGIVKVPIGV